MNFTSCPVKVKIWEFVNMITVHLTMNTLTIDTMRLVTLQAVTWVVSFVRTSLALDIHLVNSFSLNFLVINNPREITFHCKVNGCTCN